MHPRLPRRRALGGAALVGAGVLSAGLAPPVVGAAPDYPGAATITTAGPTILGAPGTDEAVADLTLHETVPGGVPAGFVCLVPSQGGFVEDGASQAPTVTTANGLEVSSPTVTSGGAVSLLVTRASTTRTGSITLGNLHATTGAQDGRSVVTVTDGLASPCATTGGHALASTAPAWAIETSTQTTYGQSAADTTAIEYGERFSCSGTTGTVRHTAVLATSADPYDALSAATLEGALGAGLLVTAPTGLDAATAHALRSDGVATVYVVGGSKAIAPSVLRKIRSTRAATCVEGRPATTGSRIKVVGPISGSTADATAAAVDTRAYALLRSSAGPPVPIDLSSVTVTTYNDTTGNASTSGIAATAAATAFVVADTDFQDAMTCGPVAYADHLPIVLTPGSHLGSYARSELSKLGISQVVVLGGQLAVQPIVADELIAEGMTVVRVAGQDATDTAAMLARFEDDQVAGMGLAWSPAPKGSALLAQGASADDALGAAPIAGRDEASIFMTESPTKGLGPYTTRALGDAGSATGLGDATRPAPIHHLQVLGGPLAVPPSQIRAALAALGGAEAPGA